MFRAAGFYGEPPIFIVEKAATTITVRSIIAGKCLVSSDFIVIEYKFLLEYLDELLSQQ